MRGLAGPEPFHDARACASMRGPYLIAICGAGVRGPSIRRFKRPESVSIFWAQVEGAAGGLAGVRGVCLEEDIGGELEGVG